MARPMALKGNKPELIWIPAAGRFLTRETNGDDLRVSKALTPLARALAQ